MASKLKSSQIKYLCINDKYLKLKSSKLQCFCVNNKKKKKTVKLCKIK